MKGKLLVALMIFASISLAGERVPPVLKGVQIANSPRIDGYLRDLQWNDAIWYGDFRQSVPKFGAPATEDTEVAFIYDNENIYIGVRCFDSNPAEIIARQLVHRQNIRKDDNISIIFDTYRDQQRGSMFQVNPLGAKEEMQVSGNRSYNMNWDEVWEVKTQITEFGWEAEFRIPLRVLRFEEGPDQTWSVNVRRVIRRKREEVYLAPPEPPRDISSLNYYASLTNLELDLKDRNLQVIPYILNGAVYDSEDDETTMNVDAGMDLKYSVTSNLTLDATFNTDFAQVESDTEQVNLSRFSLFFPEKREFFLENAQLFSFGDNPRRAQVMPFFSRRIGLYDGETVPIEFGARLTGKVGKQDVGLLSVRTGAVDELGVDEAFYNVVRLKRNVHGRSFLGGILTDSRKGDFRSSTYGIDGEWWLSDGLSLSGYVMNVDQEDIEDQHMAWKTSIDYTSDSFGVFINHQEVGENFDPDLGFVRRSGFRRDNIFTRFSHRPGNWIRQISARIITNWTSTMAGPLESSDSSLRFQMDLESGDRFEANYQMQFERLFEPFDLSDELIFTEGDYDFNTINVNYRSDNSRRFSWNINTRFGDYFDASRRDIGGNANYIFNRHLQTGLSISNFDISRESGGAINWTLLRWNVRYTVNSGFFVTSFLQYNSSTDTIVLNLRMHLMYGDDSDLFIVFNERRIEDELESWRLDYRQALVKINYRYYF